MYKFSQLFIFCPFLHGCISFRVFSAVPYSCLLSKMCAAYADVVLLDLMYLVTFMRAGVCLSDLLRVI
jgi:hypothetical protein